MSLTLSNDDCCAVDLLLDRHRSGGYGISPCFSRDSSEKVEERINRMESMLHLLDYDSVADSESNLTAKTLAFIADRAEEPRPEGADQSTSVGAG